MRVSEAPPLRFTMELNKQFDDVLSYISAEDKSTKAAAIRKAVYFYAHIQNELAEGNKKLKIVDEESGNETIYAVTMFLANPSRQKRRSKVKEQRKTIKQVDVISMEVS